MIGPLMHLRNLRRLGGVAVFSLCGFSISPTLTLAQTSESDRSIAAVRTDAAPTIDGMLAEDEWSGAPGPPA